MMIAVALHFEPAAFLCLLIGALSYIIWRGDHAERACVIAITLGSLATALAMNKGPVWYRAELGIFAVDVATLIAFIGIMALSNRFWPLWITAFQIVAVATHIARIVQPKTIPIAYAVAEQLWAYPMLAIIVGALASVQHDRRPLIVEYVKLADQLTGALTRAVQHIRGTDAATFENQLSPKNREINHIRAAKRVILARKRRNLHFGPKLFEDPNWDMLLDLYVAKLENRRISVSSLTIASNVPGTTALRHIATLEQQGEIEREPDPDDRRRSFIRLTDRAYQNMERWLEETIQQS